MRKLYNVDGELLGAALHKDGNIQWYRKPSGESDCFIWKFKDGLNKRIKWNAL
jgi:hypothetical protein